MSDYRYQIVRHKGIDCLSVMIDGKEIARTHIPITDIERSIEIYKAQVAREEKKDESPRLN